VARWSPIASGQRAVSHRFNKVTATSVSFRDNANFSVSIQRIGGKSALGKAHGPMGDGSALYGSSAQFRFIRIS
jgi:hypothetical protein